MALSSSLPQNVCDIELPKFAERFTDLIDGSDAIAATVFDALDTEHKGFLTKAQYKDQFFKLIQTKVIFGDCDYSVWLCARRTGAAASVERRRREPDRAISAE